MSFIFVAGCYGVGKSVICREVAEYFKLGYKSASKIISDETGENFDSTKTTKSVKKNQEIVKKSICNSNDNEYLLLDGHYCIINNGEIKILPADYDSFKPVAVIVLTLDIETISKRLLERDNIEYTKAILDELQSSEVRCAKEESIIQNIPLLIVDSESQKDQIFRFVKDIIKEV